jgi:hypothetical protein
VSYQENTKDRLSELRSEARQALDAAYREGRLTAGQNHIFTGRVTQARTSRELLELRNIIDTHGPTEERGYHDNRGPGRWIDSQTLRVDDGVDLVYDDAGKPHYVIVENTRGLDERSLEEVLAHKGFNLWCDASSWRRKPSFSTCVVHEDEYVMNSIKLRRNGMNDLGVEIDWFRDERRARREAQRWADAHDRTAYVDYSPHYPLARDRGGLYVAWASPTSTEMDDTETPTFDLDAAFGQRTMQVKFEPKRLRDYESNGRRYSAKHVSSLGHKSLAELRRMQDLNSSQINEAYRTGNRDALEELQTRDYEIQDAIDRVEFGDEHVANSSEEYWVWAVDKKNQPLSGEGPWGPYSFKSARDYARISATKGKHDRAVSIGHDPASRSFEIMRVYKAGSGEHAYGVAQRIGAPMNANARRR